MRHKLRKYQSDWIDRQRNVAPHDTLRNGTALDAALYRGQIAFTPVQRIGMFIYGSIMLFLGVAVGLSAIEVRGDFMGAGSVVINDIARIAAAGMGYLFGRFGLQLTLNSLLPPKHRH